MVKFHRLLEIFAFVVCAMIVISVAEGLITTSVIKKLTHAEINKLKVSDDAGETEKRAYYDALDAADSKRDMLTRVLMLIISVVLLLVAFTTNIASLSFELFVVGLVFLLGSIANYLYSLAYWLAGKIAVGELVWPDGKITPNIPYAALVNAFYIIFLAIPVIVFGVLYYRSAKRRGLV